MPVSSDKHIAVFATKPNPKPQPDIAVTRAFHTYAYEKIVRQIQSSNPELQMKSIRCCREFLTQPQQQQQCIKAGIVDVLKDALSSKDDDMCCEAAAALQIIAMRALGCQALIDAGALEQLAVLIESQSSRVRRAAYTTLVEASHSHVTRSWMQSSGSDVIRSVTDYLLGLNGLALLEKLVRCAEDETDDECASMALQLLRSSLISMRSEPVTLHLIENASAVQTCSGILSKSTSPPVIEAVGSLLALLCVSVEGREIALTIAVIETILSKTADMLQLEEDGAIVALMGALMAITVDDKAKQHVYDAGVDIFVDTLDASLARESASKVILNTLQCISNMAEHPLARATFRERGIDSALQRVLSQATEEGKTMLATTAERTMTICKFVHLPRLP